MYKFRLMSVFVILAMLFSFTNVSPAAAEETSPPDPSGWTQGTGVHFELPDSPYLPVTLDSSAPVTLTLSSVPKVVDLIIGADAAAGSAEFTLSGFAANTLYYHYEDEGLDPVAFTTDANGSFTFTQDLSESHHVWFRETPSTYYLYGNATGGDCTSFGAWDWGTKTCTMTQNVYQTIFIQANGITLDGDGFSSLGTNNYYAVYSYGRNDVTIKNLNVSGSTYGIWAIYGNNLTVTNNSVAGGYYGIITYGNSGTNNVTITNNTISNPSYYGIYADWTYNSGNLTIDQNTISAAGNYGILTYSYGSSGAVAITNNVISGLNYGILAYYPNNWTMTNNTISNSYYYGLYLYNYYSGSASVYNNNFINNSNQIIHYYGTASYNMAAPVGGNFFSDFNTPGQGCNNANSDSFCDSPYYFNGGQDNLPWTVQDGWLNQAPTADAGGPYLVAVNSSIAFDGSGSTDPDGDTLTETWIADGGSVAGNMFTAGTEAGIFDVCLTVFDGTVDSAEVCTIAVVYDPSGGFVTGGGWIDSQAGAYKDDESLSGKATFGFVSKYKKGANVPTGNTEFHFQAAGFNFHSGTYEWLVVNQGGANAQFKGEGTVNGALDSNGNAYKFMLWAGDDSTDTFRIRIWSELDGVETVVYDNGFDQELGGGSIVIHTKK